MTGIFFSFFFLLFFLYTRRKLQSPRPQGQEVFFKTGFPRTKNRMAQITFCPVVRSATTIGAAVGGGPDDRNQSAPEWCKCGDGPHLIFEPTATGEVGAKG